jgi:hypothetical protein
VQIVWNRSCRLAVLRLVLFSSLIDVAVGDVIKLPENSNLDSPSWFALALMTERLHGDVEISSGFVSLRWSDEF